MSKPAIPKQIRNYNIMKELGRGSFATVCKAFNKSNRKMYAVKVFPKSNLRSETQTERFQREVNATAYLKHDNIVALHDFFWDDENFYLVLDLCPGGELFDYIVKHDHLSEPEAALVLKQIASALSYCHAQGVAHRDLKPENVLIEKWPKIKVSDFGLCGYLREDELMSTFCGSTLYCAPECLSQQEYDGRASDVWSLGVILFSMVTGDNPWKGANMAQMVTQIKTGNYTVPDSLSDACRELITGMLQVTASARMTIDDVLAHRWLDMADMGKLKIPSELPPLHAVLMEEIAKMSNERSKQSSHGVFSPFEEMESEDVSGAMPLGKSRMPSLPQLCVRSDSLEKIAVSRNPRRTVNANLTLVGNRQKSAAMFNKTCPLPVRLRSLAE